MSDKLKYYKQLWNLIDDGKPFSSYSGLLQSVTCDGKKCMLKIAAQEKDKRGNELMAWWNGNGAAPVLKCDENALLMERAMGSRSLTEMAKNGEDDEASRIICAAIAKLHAQKGPYPADLVPLDTWFKDLGPAAAKYCSVFVQCSEIANKLLNDLIEITVLHGDIHHGNILDFGPKGWLAIDPKGLLGERGFDYANLFCNPDIVTATKPGRLARQVQIVSEQAKIDPKRLLQWIAAWAGLSAALSLGDGENAEPVMTIAKIAVNELNII
jgi:streptomycin 6-kinase